MFRRGSARRPVVGGNEDNPPRGPGALRTAVEAQNEGRAEGNLTRWATRRQGTRRTFRRSSPRPRRSPRLAARGSPQRPMQRSPPRQSAQRSPQRTSPRRSPNRRARSPKKGVSPTRPRSRLNTQNQRRGFMGLLPDVTQPFKRFSRRRNKKARAAEAAQKEEKQSDDNEQQGSTQSGSQETPVFAAASFVTARPHPSRLPIPRALLSQTNSLGTQAIQGSSSSTGNKPVNESPVEFLFEAARRSRTNASKSNSFDGTHPQKNVSVTPEMGGRRRRHTVDMLDEKTRLLSLQLDAVPSVQEEPEHKARSSLDGSASNDENKVAEKEDHQPSESHSLSLRGRDQ